MRSHPSHFARVPMIWEPIGCGFWILISFLQVMHLDAEKEMMSQCVALLGKFIAVREPNIRYLGLVSHRDAVTLFF